MHPASNLSAKSPLESVLFRRRSSLKQYLLLLLLLLIAYAPVSTFYYAINNDAFSDNFPPKYFLSEALHSGMLPLWNPYMNFGFPVYADMGFAFWNPVTWLFALIGYNAYTLTAEILLYIYISGVFMYRLAVFFKFDEKVSLAVAAMYMCSGFFVGSLQYVNFLTGAAFLPLLIMAFLALLKAPSLQKSIILALAAYMIFAGGHPAIPLALVYFMLIFSLLLFIRSTEHARALKKSIKYLLAAVLLFLLAASPVIYSYSSILSNYSRYADQQGISLLDTGFNPLSYLSFFFPLVTVVKHSVFGNDIAMRNAYFSISAVVFLVIGLQTRKNLNTVFLLTGIIMLVFCAGGQFKQSLYANLPLLRYVRTNGEYRVFSILCFCLCSGFGLQSVFESERAGKSLLRYAGYLKVILLALIILLPVIFFPGFSDYVKSTIQESTNIISIAKNIYNKAPLQVLLFIEAIIAFVFLWILLVINRKKQFNRIVYLIAADLIVHTVLYMPATGIGIVTLQDIEDRYRKYPKGIVIPQLIPVRSIDTFDAYTNGLVGDASYYNKQIGCLRMTDYPSYFKTTEAYFNGSAKDTVSQMPYLFLRSDINKNENASAISVREFKPTFVIIHLTSPKADTLVFLQNNYKFWKAYVNDVPVALLPGFRTFMTIPVEKGESEIRFYYKDPALGWFILISIVTIICCSFYLIINKKWMIAGRS